MTMADEGTAKENEGDKKIIHTYPLVKVNKWASTQRAGRNFICLIDDLFVSYILHSRLSIAFECRSTRI